MKHTGRGTAEGGGNAAQICHNGLDSIAFAFDLRLETFHFVAVERVGDILRRVSKMEAFEVFLLTRRMLRVAMIAVEAEKLLRNLKKIEIGKKSREKRGIEAKCCRQRHAYAQFAHIG